MKNSKSSQHNQIWKNIRNWPGFFIVFEGIDGTGKTSQITRLASFLQSLRHQVICTREPSDGPHGTRLRQLFHKRETLSREQELQLFIDDRKDHLQTTVLPALNRGDIVLCDRYFLSTVAYQGATGHFTVDELLTKNAFAPAPDLALLLQAPLSVCLNRITAGRNDTLNDFEQKHFLEKTADIFSQLSFSWLKTIDCSKTMDSVETEIQQHILHLLRQGQKKIEQ